MKQYFLSNEEQDIHLVFEHVTYQNKEQKETDIHQVLSTLRTVLVDAFKNIEFTLSNFISIQDITYTLSDGDKRFYTMSPEGLYSYKTKSDRDHLLLANGEKVEGRIYYRSS